MWNFLTLAIDGFDGKGRYMRDIGDEEEKLGGELLVPASKVSVYYRHWSIPAVTKDER